MKKIAILGSTGSIGTQALDLCRRHPDRYRVTALTARGSREKLFAQVREFRPEMAGLTEGIDPAEIPEDLKFCRWMSGREALKAAAAEVEADQVLVSIVGIAGLQSVLDALQAGGRQPAGKNPADSLRRTFPQLGSGTYPAGNSSGSAPAPELEHGREDHRGLRQHVQQRTGNHGSPVAF